MCSAPAVDDRAQLRGERVGLRERQRQAALRRPVEEGRRLVASEVERAHRRHAAAEPRRATARAAARCCCSVGHAGASRNASSVRRRPTPAAPGGEPSIDLGRRRGIAEERDPAAVECLGREAAQPSERAAPPRAPAQRLLRLLELRRAPDRPRRRPARRRGRAPCRPRSRQDRRAERDGHRQAERASDDRGMRRRRAFGERDADDAALSQLELRDLRRPEIARDEGSSPRPRAAAQPTRPRSALRGGRARARPRRARRAPGRTALRERLANPSAAARSASAGASRVASSRTLAAREGSSAIRRFASRISASSARPALRSPLGCASELRGRLFERSEGERPGRAVAALGLHSRTTIARPTAIPGEAPRPWSTVRAITPPQRPNARAPRG